MPAKKKPAGKKPAIQDLPSAVKGAKNVKGGAKKGGAKLGAAGGDDDLEDLEVERNR